MQLLADLVVGVVALLHLAFMIVEMFFWESSYSVRAFKLSPELAKETTRFAANIGLYNGFVVAGLVWGLLSTDGGFVIKAFFLSCVVIAGIFGGVTVNRSIILVQGLPAALALLLVVLAK